MFRARDLVGFSVASTELKVQSLLVQWIKRFAFSLSGWVDLMSFWFLSHFNASPIEVFSHPFDFDPAVLPPFYAAIFEAWNAVHGSGSVSGLVIASASPLPVDSISCKACYQMLLSFNPCVPHCVSKFRLLYQIDWRSTWHSLFLLPLDRQVIDLNWKVAHGVLYTADRLVSFGYAIPNACFCGFPLFETLQHLFFHCPLVQSGISFIQSLLFGASPAAPTMEESRYDMITLFRRCISIS